MSSLRRINASRINGALSRGPKTPEGKGRSSQNAIRHGLLAECVVLPGESRAAFDQFVAGHLETIAPRNDLELGYVEDMASAWWRMRRAWAIENCILADGVLAQPPGDDLARITAAFKQAANSTEFPVLQRYETRLHLMYQRALHNILLLRVAAQDPELPNEPNPINGHSDRNHQNSPEPQAIEALPEPDTPTNSIPSPQPPTAQPAPVAGPDPALTTPNHASTSPTPDPWPPAPFSLPNPQPPTASPLLSPGPQPPAPFNRPVGRPLTSRLQPPRLGVKEWTMRGAICIGSLLLFPSLSFAADAGSAPPVTFAKDVAPIFQEKCQECHRKGTAAPMSLVTYEETRPWARSIRQRVITRNMPPWHLDKTVGIQEFANDRSLNDAQIAAIVRWVDAGAPMGNPKDMPPPRQFPEDQSWLLAKQYGQPDLVLKSEDYTMAAHGQDVWFKPLTQVGITEPRWVRAVEMRPGTVAGRKMMHHVLARLIQDETGGAAGDDNSAASAGLLMEWAIGKNFDIYRPNCGKLLLPGSRIWWELHLHAVGEEIRDHAELAVYLYPKGETPKYRTYLTLFGATPAFGSRIDIAPNSASQTQAYHVLARPARLENFQPHMHLRGKAMSIEAILPDGTTQILSMVDHFNFNWMNNYIYTDDSAPVLPKGTMIHITAWHDNTRNNPNNPDPDQWVGFGDRTVDEMAHAWVNVTYISDEDYAGWLAKHRAKRAPGNTSNLQ